MFTQNLEIQGQIVAELFRLSLSATTTTAYGTYHNRAPMKQQGGLK